MAKLSISYENTKPTTPTSVIIPPTPQSALNGVLPEKMDTEEDRKGIVCTEYLDEKTLEEAKAWAQKEYPNFLENWTALLNYGQAEVQQLNDLIVEMREEIQIIGIPELLEMATDLGKKVAGLNNRFDPKREEIKKRIKDELDGKRGLGLFLGNVKSLVEEIRIESAGTIANIESVSSLWEEKISLLTRNVALDDAFYKQNEADIIGVIKVIAGLELIRELALEDLKKAKLAANDRMSGERQRQLNDFVDVLNLKISEFRTRMSLGWSTSPQITERRKANVSLINKLVSQRNLIVPLLMGVVESWTRNIESQGAARFAGTLSETAEMMFKALAENSAEVMPEVIAAANKPTISAETFDHVSEVMEKQNAATLAVLETARESHRQVNLATERAQRLMQEANDRSSDSVIEDQIRSAAKRLSS